MLSYCIPSSLHTLSRKFKVSSGSKNYKFLYILVEKMVTIAHCEHSISITPVIEPISYRRAHKFNFPDRYKTILFRVIILYLTIRSNFSNNHSSTLPIPLDYKSPVLAAAAPLISHRQDRTIYAPRARLSSLFLYTHTHVHRNNFSLPPAGFSSTLFAQG